MQGEQVSLAGVSFAKNVQPTPQPTTPAPTTPPPSCAATSGAPQFVSTPGCIGFSANSLLGLQAPNQQLVLAYLRTK